MKNIKSLPNSNSFKIVSLFSGCGGLDLGFEKAGLPIVWGNDYDKNFWETFQKNFKGAAFDGRSITQVPSAEIPDGDGFIGGPPCQSWSLAGSMKGLGDNRGKLFYEYVRILKDKQPLFFLAENVPGIISKTHLPEFLKIVEEFKKIGYEVSYKKVVAADYGASEERARVIIVGFRKDLHAKFVFPSVTHGESKELKPYVTQRDAFGDLPAPIPALAKNKTNGQLDIPNHEYFTGSFSPRFMSRNRIRKWDEVAFTVEASGRHAKLHPDSPPMIKVGPDLWKFDSKRIKEYRRLSVRESARIQGFPDKFIFYYTDVNQGYKMIGNAVPVKLAYAMASAIKSQLVAALEKKRQSNKVPASA